MKKLLILFFILFLFGCKSTTKLPKSEIQYEYHKGNLVYVHKFYRYNLKGEIVPIFNPKYKKVSKRTIRKMYR